MSRVLAELLGESESVLKDMIHRLETQSEHPNVDVKLSAEIVNKVAIKIKELGLDPIDTNGPELFNGLQTLVKKHDEFLVKAIGGSDPANIADLLPKIVSTIKKLPINQNCWLLKHSSAKKLLKDTPPKKLMKFMGYRSIDSMLKRENADLLFIGVRLVESQTWLKRFIAGYKTLKSSDFETRKIKIIVLTEDKWSKPAKDFIGNKHHNIAHLKEMGVIGILPLPINRLQGISIVILPLLIHYVNEIRLYSAYFKMQQVKPNFASILIDSLLNDSKTGLMIGGEQVHWRAMQKHFGRSDSSTHPQVFEPHLQPEDLSWKSAEEVIYKLEPALKFWEGLDFVAALRAGVPVPLGLMDNAVSNCNNLAYGKHSIQNFQNSLRTEIFVRYLGQKPLEEQIIRQLDESVPDSELVFAEGF